MRILVDGKQVDSLDPKIARRLGTVAAHLPVEGVVLSAGQIIATVARRLKTGMGIVGGLSGAVMTVAVIFAIGYEPGVMVVVGPVYLVIVASVGWLFSFLYRRSISAVGDKAARRLARMAPPGTPIRLDTAGLTLDGRATPWSDIAIEAVEIITEYVNDGPNGYQIEAVLLDVRGQPVVLDDAAISNGEAFVATALRTLGAPWPMVNG